MILLRWPLLSMSLIPLLLLLLLGRKKSVGHRDFPYYDRGIVWQSSYGDCFVDTDDDRTVLLLSILIRVILIILFSFSFSLFTMTLLMLIVMVFFGWQWSFINDSTQGPSPSPSPTPSPLPIILVMKILTLLLLIVLMLFWWWQWSWRYVSSLLLWLGDIDDETRFLSSSSSSSCCCWCCFCCYCLSFPSSVESIMLPSSEVTVCPSLSCWSCRSVMLLSLLPSIVFVVIFVDDDGTMNILYQSNIFFDGHHIVVTFSMIRPSSRPKTWNHAITADPLKSCSWHECHHLLSCIRHDDCSCFCSGSSLSEDDSGGGAMTPAPARFFLCDYSVVDIAGMKIHDQIQCTLLDGNQKRPFKTIMRTVDHVMVQHHAWRWFGRSWQRSTWRERLTAT